MKKNPWITSKGKPKLASGNQGKKEAKIEIRRMLAKAIGGPVHVFEAFAGSGSMYRYVWRDFAASYTGCDKRYFADGRRVFVADNRRVLRAIDLAQFNLFDLDAYGEPWPQAIIIAARRKLIPGERVGFAVTESGLNYMNGGTSNALKNIIGAHHLPGAVLYRMRPDVHRMAWAELARRMGGRVERRWQAESKVQAAMIYMAVVLIGDADAHISSRSDSSIGAAVARHRAGWDRKGGPLV